MDFDEILDQFLNDIAEAVDNVPSGTGVLDSIQDQLEDMLDNFNNAGIELSDEQNELLISKISDSVHEPQETVQKAIDAIHSSTGNPEENITEIDHKKWKEEFTSGDCWDECRASTKDPSKRMTCGYYL